MYTTWWGMTGDWLYIKWATVLTYLVRQFRIFCTMNFQWRRFRLRRCQVFDTCSKSHKIDPVTRKSNIHWGRSIWISWMFPYSRWVLRLTLWARHKEKIHWVETPLLKRCPWSFYLLWTWWSNHHRCTTIIENIISTYSGIYKMIIMAKLQWNFIKGILFQQNKYTDIKSLVPIFFVRECGFDWWITHLVHLIWLSSVSPTWKKHFTGNQVSQISAAVDLLENRMNSFF